MRCVSREKDAARVRWRVETHGVEEGAAQHKSVAEYLSEVLQKRREGAG